MFEKRRADAEPPGNFCLHRRAEVVHSRHVGLALAVDGAEHLARAEARQTGRLEQLFERGPIEVGQIRKGGLGRGHYLVSCL